MVKFHDDVRKGSQKIKNSEWVVPVENPVGKNEVNFGNFQKIIANFLGLSSDGLSYYLVKNSDKVEKLEDASIKLNDNKYAKKVIYVCPNSCDVSKLKFSQTEVSESNFPEQP